MKYLCIYNNTVYTVIDEINLFSKGCYEGFECVRDVAVYSFPRYGKSQVKVVVVAVVVVNIIDITNISSSSSAVVVIVVVAVAVIVVKVVTIDKVVVVVVVVQVTPPFPVHTTYSIQFPDRGPRADQGHRI